MAEELILTDPDVEPEKVVTSYKVVGLNLDFEFPITATQEVGLVGIRLRDNLGGALHHQYEGDAAIDMMKWLNTANFSVNSMQKRILQKLSNDGVIPGTVTGTPDPPPAEL
jgi:hypothetical protein